MFGFHIHLRGIQGTVRYGREECTTKPRRARQVWLTHWLAGLKELFSYRVHADLSARDS